MIAFCHRMFFNLLMRAAGPCRLVPLLFALAGALSPGVAGAQNEPAHAVENSGRASAPAASAPSASSSSASSSSVSQQPLSSAENDYVLSPGDTIELSVFREPDLLARSTIARDGSVQLPLIREIKLADLTVREARTLLTKLYSEQYLVNPQISLSVVQFAQRKFTIMGQVARPGSYELQGGQSLGILEAIGMAGGFTRIADRGRVIVRRGTGGEGRVFKLNAKRMAEGKIEMFEILPGDVITVGESWF